MPEVKPADFAAVYEHFQAPIAALNCGEKCAPYNEHGVPFCCDTKHAVPTAYQAEWNYLKGNTDLWHLWHSDDPAESQQLQAQTPTGQVLIACQGYERCQRGFRSITCRSFPFFPYIDREGRFIGMSYYWDYEDRCWVISNLRIVSKQYRVEFIAAYDELFRRMPEELDNFQYHSAMMRRIFSRRKRAIPLLHRNGDVYKITPRNGRMRSVAIEKLPRFGPYKIAAQLLFPEEVSHP
jgi:hypothetical protein